VVTLLFILLAQHLLLFSSSQIELQRLFAALHGVKDVPGNGVPRRRNDDDAKQKQEHGN
jgi:hypothetical protein